MTIVDYDEVKETIRDFVQSAVRTTSLDENENLFESGVVNSLFAIQLMTFIERKFDIEVSSDDLDLENFESLNAMTAFVARKQSQPHT